MRSGGPRMKRLLPLTLAAALLAVVAACNGGDPEPEPSPPRQSGDYVAAATAVAADCSVGIGVVVGGFVSGVSAESAARQRCISEAGKLGLSGRRCVASSHRQDCAAVAGGQDTTARCHIVGYSGQSLSHARSNALQGCRQDRSLGVVNPECQLVTSGCPSRTSSTLSATWRPDSSPPPRTSESVVAFGITDACNDGSDMQYRFFHYSRHISSGVVARGSLVGQWPSGGGVYITQGLNQRREHRLNCTPGYGVCYGANRRSNPGAGSWGAGIDGSNSCDSCCVTCPDGREGNFGRRLTCN